jgi:hypothetical protein
MIGAAPQRHKMARAFLAWLEDDDTSHLHQIAQAFGFQLSSADARLAWARDPGILFHMVLLRDRSNVKELVDAIIASHADGRLPLFLIQYSDDPTDARGDHVFDIYVSNSELAITHGNRVYTRRG